MRTWVGRLDLCLLALVAAVLASAALAELAMRVFGDTVLRPDQVAAKSPIYRPAVFSRHVMRKKKHTIAHGKIRYAINAHGYRGPYFEPDKPAGRTRVLIYGGSAVIDHYVSPSWPERVDRALKGAGLTNVEVINMGIAGHASFDSLGRLLAEGHRFKPDVVLLYNAWNDIKFFREKRPLLRAIRPWAPNADPRNHYMNSTDEFLSRNSQLYVRLRARYVDRHLRLDAEGRKPKDKTLHDDYLPSGPEQYRIGVGTFADLARQIGAKPILMTQARLPTSGNHAEVKDHVGYHHVRLTHDALVRAFAETDAAIADIGRAKNVAIIDASAKMTGGKTFFRDHVHLTEAGSERLAEITAAALGELLTAE